jgi:hypothetical protein
MVDETWIKVGSQEAWLWLAFEPYGRFLLGFYLSRTCNILTAELFLQSLIDRYGRHPVYSECFRVLKQNKFMVVVVKDIRRKGLTIPLGADTIKLCQLAGFEVFDIIVNKMYFPSFWQLAHAQKTQAKGIPMTLRTHEYVLVFRKPI